jgi:transketolase
MGDQIGEAVSGKLYYIKNDEFERILSSQNDKVEIANLFASFCRINTLYMIARAGSGHIGSSFSSIDIMSWIQLNETPSPSDSIFFSSKGHDAPALYATLIGVKKLNFEFLHLLRKKDGLPGHPDIHIPFIETNTGSLGMGLSKAKGMAIANRHLNASKNIFVMTGDGEIQEGQFWESIHSAVNNKLSEITIIVDHNKLQSDTLVSKVSDLGDLVSKFRSFGLHVERCDGNNIGEFANILEICKTILDKPKIIIADTVKGKGVSFMEHTSIDSDVELYKFHSGAPSSESYQEALQELIDNANYLLEKCGLSPLALDAIDMPKLNAVNSEKESLISAYSKSLLKHAANNQSILALDADLILDTGLIPFKERFPERFIECGIAEQDMVSQAGGLSLKGMLPIVHSFSCFLSSRPNEQIYNNATEKKKIIYVGSLAGVLPGGPGHSHQAVRDIGSLKGMPFLKIFEPCCSSEVGLLMDWAINSYQYSSYLRLVSVPWEIPFTLPKNYIPQEGKGCIINAGEDITIIGYGPILLSEAFSACNKLQVNHGISIKLINLPWLNYIDSSWLHEEVSNSKIVISLDNHYLNGGQGEIIADALLTDSNSNKNLIFHRMAIEDIPSYGSNEEVLASHCLDSKSIYERVLSLLDIKKD